MAPSANQRVYDNAAAPSRGVFSCDGKESAMIYGALEDLARYAGFCKSLDILID